MPSRPPVGHGPLPRRAFLRGTGVAMALPVPDAMRPAAGATPAAAGPRRMVAIETNMGILPQFAINEVQLPRGG